MTITKCDKCDGMVDIGNGGICNSCGLSISTTVVKNQIPVFKFRPPPHFVGYGYGKQGLKYYGVRRYAGGKWLPYYGEYDLAFIGYTKGGRSGGAPIFCGVDMSGKQHFHPNTVAYNSACDACTKLNSCASGIEIKPENCIIVMQVEE